MFDVDIQLAGNLIEAALWFAVCLFLLFKASGAPDELRRICLLLALSFFVFGLSDLIESQTGAWWRPWWLVVMKGACVVGFVVGFARYYRFEGEGTR